jgi:hypothetical protein
MNLPTQLAPSRTRRKDVILAAVRATSAFSIHAQDLCGFDVFATERAIVAQRWENDLRSTHSESLQVEGKTNV